MSLVFEITIKPRSGVGWPVLVEQEEPDQLLAATDQGLLELDLVHLRSQADPVDYGTVLGMALFRGQIRDAFVRALTRSDDRLHVVLLVEDAELRALHWE